MGNADPATTNWARAPPVTETATDPPPATWKATTVEPEDVADTAVEPTSSLPSKAIELVCPTAAPAAATTLMSEACAEVAPDEAALAWRVLPAATLATTVPLRPMADAAV